MSLPTESWLPSANAAGCEFPLANLPYGAAAVDADVHLVVAIGDQMLDLQAAAVGGALTGLPAELLAACRQPALNALMGLGTGAASQLRARLQRMLSAEPETSRFLLPQNEAAMRMPMVVGDYTDFYASIHHATNVGKRFRPQNPLLPNYEYVPVGYHGRSSSIGVSPETVRRPQGQLPGAEGGAPSFGPSRQLDYEVEIGIVIGAGNALGEPIAMNDAESHIFGVCLLNDWSARDIQRWEYQPLGPFLGKNFATTISPWIVPWEALHPFRAPRALRDGHPEPLAYLDEATDRARGALDITIEAWVNGERLSSAHVRDLYWTPGQMVAHHTSNGCNLRPGDLLGSGTISGPEPGSWGCLLEMGRPFLADGDEVVLRARAEGAGRRRLGWGDCRGRVAPAGPKL